MKLGVITLDQHILGGTAKDRAKSDTTVTSGGKCSKSGKLSHSHMNKMPLLSFLLCKRFVLFLGVG